MIVGMKKTTVLCMDSDRGHCLEKLRELGILHVDESQLHSTASGDIVQLENMLLLSEKAILALNSVKGAKAEKTVGMDGESICQKVTATLQELSSTSKRLEHVKRDRDSLLPWGEFSASLLEDLEKKSIHAVLCAGSEKEFSMAQESLTVELINEYKGKKYFVAISDQPLSLEKLPVVTLPKLTSLAQTDQLIGQLQQRINELESALEQLRHGLDTLKTYRIELLERLEFAKFRDGMLPEGKIAYIHGYIPQPREAALKEAASQNGWALLLLDPEEEDRVPTLVETPKIFEVSRPIFDFIGISPGYREWDISTCFLIFFTIFFGMIVGDAGYGLLFLLTAVVLKVIFPCQKSRLVLNLFILLSAAAIFWGVLNANYFGIPADNLPRALSRFSIPLKTLPSWVKNIDTYKKELYVPRDKLQAEVSATAEKINSCSRNEREKLDALKKTLDFQKKELSGINSKIINKNIQYLCFLIAAIHLSLARFWKTMLYFKDFTKALGQLGWGLMIWGNFFLAVNLIVFDNSFPGFALYFYLVGLLLILLFSVNWKSAGDVMNFPFSLIGSFVDVLSYIRLFAVGMSTYFIADSFNNMGLMVLEISPVLIIATIGIIIFGHTLNIVLAFMGVLVHGIRLNTLEFSNHMELAWNGFVFKPFKKLLYQDTSKEE